MNESLKAHAKNVKKPKYGISEIHHKQSGDYCGFIQTVLLRHLVFRHEAADCPSLTKIHRLYRPDLTISSSNAEYCGINDNELPFAGFIAWRNALE
jgi:hypothetical protein